MTVADIHISNNKYTLEKENIVEILKSIKYSLISIRLVRNLGFYWSKEILKPMLDNVDKRTTDVSKLPEVPIKLLEKLPEGRIIFESEITLSKTNFLVDATTSFDSEYMDLNVNKCIHNVNKFQQTAIYFLTFVSSHNLNVENITFHIPSNNRIKITSEITVPKTIKRM